jgi:O-antigen ligase
MSLAHAIALAAIPFATVAGTAAACWSRHVRDLFFFAMVTLAVYAERMEVNFFSTAWYRGTTRGLQITLVEILAFCLLVGCWAAPRDGKRPRFWPASLGLLLAFFAYAALSVLASTPRIFGLFELSRMAGAIVIFAAAAAYVRSRREWTLLLVALGCAVALEGAWAVEQHFVTHVDRAEGSLDHANSLSMYCCLTVPLLVAGAFAGWSRLLNWFCAVCAALGAVGLVLTFSRAGIPVFALVVLGTIGACASWRPSPRRIAVWGVLLAGAVALTVALWSQIAERYAQSTLEEEYLDPTVDGRGVYLRLAPALARDHFLGVGLNNWSYQVSRTYGPRLGFMFADYDNLVAVYGTTDNELFADAYLAPPAHNLAALTLGELGLPGLILFTLLWLRWFGMGAAFLRVPRADPMRLMGVGIFFGTVGIFGQSLTEWVYRQTPILYTFYILLGTLASLAAARRRAGRIERTPAFRAAEAVLPEEVLAGEGV